MALYQINISYDGTDFFGYQRQEDKRTVQGEIERALATLGWKSKSIISSGRTDSGVHAEGQVATFELDWHHSEEKLRKALNSSIPKDISINSVKHITNLKFHPRFDAKSRIYRYQIYLNEYRNPLLEKYSWRVWPSPQMELLNMAAQTILGLHDFAKFGRPYQKHGRTERIIYEANWIERKGHPELVDFRIHGNSFLYHMVRRLVYIFIRVGQGHVDIDAVIDALAGIDNLPTGIAPAKGLFLEKINY